MANLNTPRLKSQLLTSGLQQKDPALFQVINQLIGAIDILNRELDNVNTTTDSGDNGNGGISQAGGMGPPGLIGYDGEDGPIGPQGIQGIAGIIGTGGPAGPTTIGPMGINGLDGDDGMPIPGPRGIQGIQGIQGFMGPPSIGPMGLDGEDGEDLGPYFDMNAYAKLHSPNTFTAHNSFKSYHSPLYDAGTSGSAKTIDWNNGPDQYLELTNNCVLSFSNPVDGGRYVLLIKGGFTITWPASVSWSSGAVPTISGATKHDLFTFLYKLSLNKYVGSFNSNYTL